jgi:hypothetical protein
MVALIGSSQTRELYVVERSGVRWVEKRLGPRDLPPSLLYAKAGSQDCLSSQVQIASVLKQTKPSLTPILRVLTCTPSLAPGTR